jgi:hypothetical protein
MIATALVAGIVIGLAYTLSPLTVIATALLAVLIRTLAAADDPHERRLLVTLVTIAVALRIAAVAVLFLWSDHQSRPFGTFFGDEDYFIKRAIWLRNAAVGIPISPADMRYAFDPSIETSLVWILAALQIVFGPAPYGVHLFGIIAYVAGTLCLYRAVRPSFGMPAAMIALATVLFLPSLFSWSVSALKDPLFLALLAAVLAFTLAAMRGSTGIRLSAVAGVPAMLVAAETLRSGGLALLAMAIGGGLLAVAGWRRPRGAGLAAAAVLLALPLALTRPNVQDAAVVGAHRAVAAHWNHVREPGVAYRLLDEAQYEKPIVIPALGVGDTVRYATRAVVAYLVVPLPWQVHSTAARAFAPEQIVWLVLVGLAVVGVPAGLRRDPSTTLLLAASAMVLALGIALTSGNIGTLVRHRSLALLPMAWLAGLGAVSTLTWAPRWFGMSRSSAGSR